MILSQQWDPGVSPPPLFLFFLLLSLPLLKLIPDHAHAYRTHISISAWLCLSHFFVSVCTCVCACVCIHVCEWLYELFISGRWCYNLWLSYLCWINKLFPYLRHYDKCIWMRPGTSNMKHKLTLLCGVFQGTWNAADTACGKPKYINVLGGGLLVFIYFVSKQQRLNGVHMIKLNCTSTV